MSSLPGRRRAGATLSSRLVVASTATLIPILLYNQVGRYETAFRTNDWQKKKNERISVAEPGYVSWDPGAGSGPKLSFSQAYKWKFAWAYTLKPTNIPPSFGCPFFPLIIKIKVNTYNKLKTIFTLHTLFFFPPTGDKFTIELNLIFDFLAFNYISSIFSWIKHYFQITRKYSKNAN